MGWETRRGRRYYYRARKVDGRVVKEYVGAGPLAELVAREDAAARAERAEARERLRQAEARVAPADAALAALGALLDGLDAAALTDAGYHRHRRGHWRRRRDGART